MWEEMPKIWDSGCWYPEFDNTSIHLLETWLCLIVLLKSCFCGRLGRDGFKLSAWKIKTVHTSYLQSITQTQVIQESCRSWWEWRQILLAAPLITEGICWISPPSYSLSGEMPSLTAPQGDPVAGTVVPTACVEGHRLPMSCRAHLASPGREPWCELS